MGRENAFSHSPKQSNWPSAWARNSITGISHVNHRGTETQRSPRLCASVVHRSYRVGLHILRFSPSIVVLPRRGAALWNCLWFSVRETMGHGDRARVVLRND